jgi:hypothetical protein
MKDRLGPGKPAKSDEEFVPGPENPQNRSAERKNAPKIGVRRPKMPEKSVPGGWAGPPGGENSTSRKFDLHAKRHRIKLTDQVADSGFLLPLGPTEVRETAPIGVFASSTNDLNPFARTIYGPYRQGINAMRHVRIYQGMGDA